MSFFKRPLKDVDSAKRAHQIHILGYGAYGGVVFGLLGFAKFGAIGFILGWLFGIVLIWAVVTLFAGRVGAVASTLYASSGSSTPAKREYSMGDALAMKGQFEDAAGEYERCAVVYPDDPEPRLRQARLYRDRMRDYEQAGASFKRVLAVPKLDPGIELQTYRELAELYTHRLKQPERALPFLAQLAAKHANTPAGEWARTEMSEIKHEMREKS